MSLRLLIFGFLAGMTILRMLLLPQIELSPQEAYHSMWADELDWGYHSGGPGVAVAMRAGIELFGHSELALRLLAPLLALATSLVIFWLAGRMFDLSVAAWSVLVLNLLPGFNFLSIFGLTDALSLLFWSAALAAFWLAIERSPKFSMWWLVAGLAAGLGFLCKFTLIFFPLSALLFLGISRKYRAEFRGAGIYVMLVIFTLCTVPLVLWNSKNQWITFLQLRSRESVEIVFGIRPGEVLEFIGTHLIVYSPLVLAAMILALVWDWRSTWRTLRLRFLLCFSAPILSFFCIRCVYQSGDVDLTAPGFIGLLIFTTAAWVEKCGSSTWQRGFSIAALAISLGISLVAFNTSALRASGIALSPERDPLSAHRGWITSASEVHLLRKEFETQLGEDVFLIADGYQTAAALGFYLPEKRPAEPGHPPVYIPESQNLENHFSFLGRYDEFHLKHNAAPADPFFTEQEGVNPFLRRSALYITQQVNPDLPNSIQNAFVAHELVGEIEVRRYGVPVRKLLVFACYNYQTAPL